MNKIVTVIWTTVLLASLIGCSPKINKKPETTYDTQQSPPVYETLTLYFPAKDGTQLIKETQVIEVTTDHSIEELILHQLQKGPKGQDMIAPIPSKVEILSVNTADGLCNVDMSEDFASCSAQSVRSIVHSLCTLDEINAVKINIAGNTEAYVNSNISLANPLSPINETDNRK